VAPNNVFILVDNVGWGDFGAYFGTIPTPRIDKCAAEGIRFHNYNVQVQFPAVVGAASCKPR
jgi:arylsulfatase A-like enzyme